jgi:Mg-chelatase subunit ChlD
MYAFKAKIDSMIAQDATYIPAGLMWGWAALTKSEPFTEAEDKVHGQPVRKIMVLMTDGFNTISSSVPYDGGHFAKDTAAANANTTQLCENVKGAGIELYTVAFALTDPTIKKILEDCASAGGKYYDAATGTDLEEAFKKIAADFSPLRLTH